MYMCLCQDCVATTMCKPFVEGSKILRMFEDSHPCLNKIEIPVDYIFLKPVLRYFYSRLQRASISGLVTLSEETKCVMFYGNISVGAFFVKLV